ncbi:MAG: FAD-dependent oxidoreductase, partial [Gaiellaceae bacterium]
TGIVPPPPIVENAIAERTAAFRVGPPLIAASRIVDPVSADDIIARGQVEAVGMTRALITDPELPRKAEEGRLDEILRCIGCNACIARYHAGLHIACAQNPRTGRERTFPPTAVDSPRRVAVIGGGPAGLAAAAEAAACGHDVVLYEREARLGGQAALAGAAPGHAELARTLLANYTGLLAGVEVRLGAAAPENVEADAVVVATGAAPYTPPVDLTGVEVLQAWDVLRGRGPRGRRVVVADWGGDASGLDAAEVLDRAGNTVTLALGSAAFGETLHQYQRNLYAARLYRAGIAVEQHLELAGTVAGGVLFRNVFAPELETALPADILVLALGRIPVRLAVAHPVVEEAGDCLSPRSLEEAILEGTLAVRRAVQRAAVGSPSP